ncbi:MAG: DNA methylase, partial [Anaerolineae bacterium]
FYLKLIELEARGQHSLDNYQNFAKAFKVRDFKPFMANERANAAQLKGATEFGRSEMGETSELYDTPLRGVLYALMELEKNVDGEDVLQHLMLNYSGYHGQRERVVEIAGYLAGKLAAIRPDEASAARVLRDLVRNQRM